MNKIRVIDLLNKIANGEEVPKKIRITDINDRITIHYNFFYDEDDQEYKDDELFPLGARLILDRVLNKKVEILDKIEEKKIPKKHINDYGDLIILGQQDNWLEPTIETDQKINAQLNPYVFEAINENFKDIKNKINELIDYLESKGE